MNPTVSTLRYDARRRAYVGTASDGTRLAVAAVALEDRVHDEMADEAIYADYRAGSEQYTDREAYWRAVYSDPDEWRHLVGLTAHVQRVEDGA